MFSVVAIDEVYVETSVLRIRVSVFSVYLEFLYWFLKQFLL